METLTLAALDCTSPLLVELLPLILICWELQDFAASADHPVYTKGDNTIFFLKDVMHHFEGWTISDSSTEIGSVTNVCPADYAEKAGNG